MKKISCLYNTIENAVSMQHTPLNYGITPNIRSSEKSDILQRKLSLLPMLIHIFGNPDLPFDALPVLLLPRLKKACPKHTFRFTDPNELDLPQAHEDFIAIDTVLGLKAVREISIDEIAANAMRATTHDFDLASYLLLVQKLRPHIHIRIIGIPMDINADTALPAITSLLKEDLPQK